MLLSRQITWMQFYMPLCQGCHSRRRWLFWSQFAALAVVCALPFVLSYLGLPKNPALILGVVTILPATIAVGQFRYQVSDWYGAGIRVGKLDEARSGAPIRFAKIERLESTLRFSA